MESDIIALTFRLVPLSDEVAGMVQPSVGVSPLGDALKGYFALFFWVLATEVV